jgi:hypothetical protein
MLPKRNVLDILVQYPLSSRGTAEGGTDKNKKAIKRGKYVLESLSKSIEHLENQRSKDSRNVDVETL